MRRLVWLGVIVAMTVRCGGSSDTGKGSGGAPGSGAASGAGGNAGAGARAGASQGGASGALKWFSTCGPPVCQVSGAGGAGSKIPACMATEKEGASCTVANAECDTGASCAGPLKCTTSDPTHGGNCPISRAKYKTDIEYLSGAERAKLANDVQSIPLVRYRYKDAPEREHLGFIIEDVEPSPSVDSVHDRVDLYGYTSMAIAALQEQRREIESLKAELAELRSELAKRARK